MAETFLRKYAGDRYEVFSAGLEPTVVNPFTIQVMDEIGVNMSSHRSKHLDVYVGKVIFNYLITVCDNAEKKCPFFPGVGIRLHWPFDDPASASGNDTQMLAKFRQVRDQIDSRVREWLLTGV